MATSTKIINENLQAAFRLFVSRTHPERLNRTVRTLLVEYLAHKYDFLPPDFHLLIDDLSHLFHFLDRLTKETRGWHDEENTTE